MTRQVRVTVTWSSELWVTAYVDDVNFIIRGSGSLLAKKEKEVFMARKHTNQLQLRSAACAVSALEAVGSQSSPFFMEVDICLYSTFVCFLATTQGNVKRIERRHKTWKGRGKLQRCNHAIA